MNTILDILEGKIAPNIHQLTLDINQTELIKLAEDYNCQVFYLDGQNINNKADFLAKIADVMDFPDYFGKNWDALQDCITDLDWSQDSQYLIVYDHWQNFSHESPADWQILNDIFLEAIAYWQTQEISLNVLLISD